MKHKHPGSGGLVYSTETGRTCPVCRQAVGACQCRKASSSVPLGDGRVRVSRESQGRGGKVVTVVRGLALDGDALLALGRQLKAACGTGGTVKDGAVEVQGDHVERVMVVLAGLGHQVKRSGG